MLTAFLWLAFIAQPPAPAPDWDAATGAQQVTAAAARLKPILEQLKPADWIAAGAPAGYQKQRQECLDEAVYIQRAAAALAADPEKLALAIDLFFRLDFLASRLDSLGSGVRRYGNPAVADLLAAAARDALAAREPMKQYLRSLAELREKEYEIARGEAQACRAQGARKGVKR